MFMKPNHFIEYSNPNFGVRHGMILYMDVLVHHLTNLRPYLPVPRGS